MKKPLVLILVVAMLAFAGSAQALVEYTANFDADKEGWTGDGENWSATDGQDGGGYYYGERTPYGPYLTPPLPPAPCILYGNVAANFENEPITFTYYLKDITQNSKSVAMYMFADADGNDAWETLWRWIPQNDKPPLEWTKYGFTIDTSASEPTYGWSFMYGLENTWIESWKAVKYWNFWTDPGTSGLNQNAIDTVLVTNDPSAVIPDPGIPLAIPGDANLDNMVDSTDAAALAANWLQSNKAWGDGDFNKDGVVNDVDATIMATNWGYGVPMESSVPEPGTVVLLLSALAALEVVRFMRRGN